MSYDISLKGRAFLVYPCSEVAGPIVLALGKCLSSNSSPCATPKPHSWPKWANRPASRWPGSILPSPSSFLPAAHELQSHQLCRWNFMRSLSKSINSKCPFFLLSCESELFLKGLTLSHLLSEASLDPTNSMPHCSQTDSSQPLPFCEASWCGQVITSFWVLPGQDRWDREEGRCCRSSRHGPLWMDLNTRDIG